MIKRTFNPVINPADKKPSIIINNNVGIVRVTIWGNLTTTSVNGRASVEGNTPFEPVNDRALNAQLVVTGDKKRFT